MLKFILLGLAGVLIVFVIMVVTRPNSFRYTRSATIGAPPMTLFPHINDLHKWQEWSPWAKVDPNAKNSFEGPGAGPGAIFRWEGNMQVGAGSMTILESHPSDFVKFQLDFLKPFKGTNIAEFTLKPEGSQTVVTWSMYGPANFVSKAMSLFMDCDKMCGDQFEKGLATLKGIAEAEAHQQTASLP